MRRPLAVTRTYKTSAPALMINQAVQQRNTQWAAEQTMFMTVVRPMLTFFEGFIYAITPIIAFIIVMGSFGVQLAGKYVQTVLWIQLWMPVLSIINLFVHTAATNQMASLSNNGLNSMYALSSTGDVLQHWIATGGMLAASTPIISLFIVSGSTYAFTSLASKISGGDHVDEAEYPRCPQAGPLMQSQPAYNQNQFSGAIASGAEGMISTLSLGSNMASGVSSAQANQKQASEAFQSNLTRGFPMEQAKTRPTLGSLISVAPYHPKDLSKVRLLTSKRRTSWRSSGWTSPIPMLLKVL